MPVGGHCRPIGFVIFGGSASILGDEPVEALAKDCVWVHHPLLFVEDFESRRDEANEGVDERGVHVDDVVARFEENRVRYFCTRAIVVSGSRAEIRHFIDIVGERIFVVRIRFTCGVVQVEVWIHRDVEQVHLLGDGRLMRLCAFADVLE